MRRWLATLALCAVVGCGGGQVDPGFYGPIVEEAPRAETKPTRAPRDFDRPKLVIIRAQWCRACDQADPSIMRAFQKYHSLIDLVVLDMTDEGTARRANRIAEGEGVSQFFDTYQGRTPTLALFEQREQGRVLRGSLLDVDYLKAEFEASLQRHTQAQSYRGLSPSDE